MHFLCVGTPQRKGEYAADLRYVDGVVDGLAPHLDRPTLVVGKSTVPVGTAARLQQRLAELAPAGEAAELAWNPEFLREGFAVEDTLQARPARRRHRVRARRGSCCARSTPARSRPASPFLVTDFATAELVKASANAFLATKISFINAMAELCEATGADVTQLADALGYDERIGRQVPQRRPRVRRRLPAQGHPGVHGPRRRARRRPGADLPQGGRRHQHAAARPRRRPGAGRRAAAASSAPGSVCSARPSSRTATTSATRPPSTWPARSSCRARQVTVYDPRGNDNAEALFPTLGYADSAVEACEGADLVLHLTEWQEFREMDPAVLADVVAEQKIIDARNALDPARWRAAGWTYGSLGRP